jgi:formiminotetrahydrofolate cyclodeaminase
VTAKAASPGSGDFADLRVRGFLDALAAGTAAPAAGSAAALVLAQAAALCAKAARLSAGQLGADLAGRLTDQAERIRAEAVSLIDEDPRAYLAVIEAARGPAAEHGPAAEKGPGAEHSPAAENLPAGGLAAALSRAADVPLRVVELAVPVAGLAAALAATGKPALRGDALSAGLLGQAGARAAATLVAINLASSPADPRHARADSLLRAIDEQLKAAH